MTVDDDNSIYVGGLSYDATEADIRRAFSLYGSVVAVKIVNDREIGGKCYGFVTFTNPRSAVDAISDMNGRTIGGRVVRVNDVRPRGRPSFPRENVRRDADWDRAKDQEREFVRDRERYKDRSAERSREHDKDREIDHDREREFDRSRDRGDDWERDRESDYGQDGDVDEDRDAIRDKDHQSRNKIRSHSDHRGRELSSDFSDKHHDQAKEQLEISIHRRDELQSELDLLEDKIEEKEQLVSDLQKKYQKLEEAVASAKKFSSQRQSLLAKLHKGFVQVQDHTDRLKASEKELQVLVDSATSEVRISGETG